MLDFKKSFSQYAVFGPYGNLCVTSLHSCTTGFTIVFWIKMEYNCAGYVLSTRDNSNTAGIDIRCDNTGLFYSITKRYGSHTVDVGDSIGRWIHVAFQADTYLNSLNVYHDVNNKHSGLVANNDIPNTASAMQSIVFGRQYVAIGGGYGSALVDDVKIYNKELTQENVQHHFNT